MIGFGFDLYAVFASRRSVPDRPHAEGSTGAYICRAVDAEDRP